MNRFWIIVLCIALERPAVGQDQALDPAPSIDYLLQQQREDGSWTSYRGPKADSDQPWSVAATAFVCMTLLDYYDVSPERISKALDKGIKSCLEQSKAPKSHWSHIWSQAYPLRLMARLIGHPKYKDRAEEFRKDAQELVDRVYKAQRKSNGWGYCTAGTCFQTADALLALKEIQQAGVKVDDEIVKRGVEFLAALRIDKKGYAYIPDAKPKQAFEELAEPKALDRSAGRNVLCEWTLLKFGRSKADDLLAAYKQFLDHRKFLWDCRAYDGTGPLTRDFMLTETGSPYVAFVFYAYQYAGLALGDVASEKDRKELAKTIRKDLLDRRDKDGTWKHCEPGFKGPDHGLCNNLWATANALMALKAIEKR